MRDEPIYHRQPELAGVATKERAKFHHYGTATAAAPAAVDDDDEPLETLQIFDAGDINIAMIPPREWLLGNTFCRRFLSGLVGAGAAGKTAVRYAQYLALASGRSLTGEYVHQRGRVLIVCLEDDIDEVKRRIGAAMLQHNVSQAEIRGWLFYCTPKRLRLMAQGLMGTRIIGGLYGQLQAAIKNYKLDLVSIDPLVKAHGVSENDNNAVDEVMSLIAELAITNNCAIDLLHHSRKGNSADAGDADRSRGASANVDAQRLGRNLATMSADEAEQFGIPEAERKSYVRVDDAKVNLTRGSEPMWFRLVGVKLGNGTLPQYPNGDEMPTVVRWYPPDIWGGPTSSYAAVFDDIADGLPDGQRYSSHGAADDRAAWKVVQRHLDLTETQAREIITVWLRKGTLRQETYRDPVARKDRQGLFVNLENRPGERLG